MVFASVNGESNKNVNFAKKLQGLGLFQYNGNFQNLVQLNFYKIQSKWKKLENSTNWKLIFGELCSLIVDVSRSSLRSYKRN